MSLQELAQNMYTHGYSDPPMPVLRGAYGPIGGIFSCYNKKAERCKFRPELIIECYDDVQYYLCNYCYHEVMNKLNDIRELHSQV
jgi:hypothetical protein